MAAHPIETRFADKVQFLSQTEAWPECPQSVTRIETHMSCVFLTDTQAYKLKKPVALPFLDFTTLAARKLDSYEEINLNRRLARDVYLDVEALVLRSDGRLCLEGQGDIVDYLVHMRRLPAHRMLDHLISANELKLREARGVARLLATFYRRAAPVHISPGHYLRRLCEDVEANATALLSPAYDLSARAIATTMDLQREFLENNQDLIFERGRRHIIEAHGDLRPEHVCLTDPPVIIDCLEFNRNFRLLDPADELAFFALECEMLDAGAVASMFCAIYEDELGDRVPDNLMAFHKSCRACLRAKLALWHLEDDPHGVRRDWLALGRTYLSRAGDYARLCVS